MRSKMLCHAPKCRHLVIFRIIFARKTEISKNEQIRRRTKFLNILYICDASNSTETGEVVEGEVLDGGEQGAVVEGEPSDNSENSENSENTGVAVVGEDGENSEEGDSSDYEDDSGSPGLIANIMSMFQLNTINSLKARFHEWWTGDNPGFRQISGETVPMEDRQFSFDVDFLAVSVK